MLQPKNPTRWELLLWNGKRIALTLESEGVRASLWERAADPRNRDHWTIAGSSFLEQADVQTLIRLLQAGLCPKQTA
jgi:hypothetical protein